MSAGFNVILGVMVLAVPLPVNAKIAVIVVPEAGSHDLWFGFAFSSLLRAFLLSQFFGKLN